MNNYAEELEQAIEAAGAGQGCIHSALMGARLGVYRGKERISAGCWKMRHRAGSSPVKAVA